jgi:hypothetical protein
MNSHFQANHIQGKNSQILLEPIPKMQRCYELTHAQIQGVSKRALQL